VIKYHTSDIIDPSYQLFFNFIKGSAISRHGLNPQPILLFKYSILQFMYAVF